MAKEDARGMLEEEPFSYAVTKDGKVRIAWQGKQVVVLQGKEAEKFTARVQGLDGKAASW